MLTRDGSGKSARSILAMENGKFWAMSSSFNSTDAYSTEVNCLPGNDHKEIFPYNASYRRSVKREETNLNRRIMFDLKLTSQSRNYKKFFPDSVKN